MPQVLALSGVVLENAGRPPATGNPVMAVAVPTGTVVDLLETSHYQPPSGMITTG